jgi:hypothetical protein
MHIQSSLPITDTLNNGSLRIADRHPRNDGSLHGRQKVTDEPPINGYGRLLPS